MKEQFFQRCEKYRDKQVDNRSLPAGSPMYYYCQGCGGLIDTREEGWLGRSPARFCDDCRVIVDLGLLDEYREEFEDASD